MLLGVVLLALAALCQLPIVTVPLWPRVDPASILVAAVEVVLAVAIVVRLWRAARPASA